MMEAVHISFVKVCMGSNRWVVVIRLKIVKMERNET